MYKKHPFVKNKGKMQIERLYSPSISNENLLLARLKEDLERQNEAKKLINNKQFFKNPASFIPMERKRSPKPIR